MPSEIPKMPHDTHQSMLGRGETPGLRLQANEVAWYPNRNDPKTRMIRYAKRTVIGLAMCAAVGTAIGFFLL